MAALAPDIESKYDVLQKMGEGGMGSVYKVRHRFLDEIQVIKLMQAGFQQNAELKERFLREAKTAKQLRHPNIAEVIDFSVTSDGTAYIVMEFIEGVNLHEILARTNSPLNHRLVITIAQQALAALGFLHRKKFVHRDISPDNLMLARDEDGKPLIKLIDLGITKSIEETKNLTMAGKFVGKVHYASPEQFGGEKIDARSDLYSFGVVLYELLTGTKPIEGRDYLSIISGHISRPPRPFSETDPQGLVPENVRHIVLKALGKNPKDRYQNSNEFWDALASVKTGPLDDTLEISIPLPIAALTQVTDVGDAIERADWDGALVADSVKGWENYLDRHPQAKRAAKAHAQLEKLEQIEENDWTEASASETIEAWRRFLEKHEESPRAPKARRRLEKLQSTEAEERSWSDATAADSVTGWELFLNAYSDSTHATQAKDRLDAARRRNEEDRDWRLAEAADSVTGWREFLVNHPDSERRQEANRHLESAEKREAEDRAWNGALGKGSVAAWQEYLRKYLDSGRVEEARSHLEEAKQREAETEAWKVASSADSADAWRAYLDSHSSSKRASEARQKLEAATAREAQQKKEAEERRRLEAENGAFAAAKRNPTAANWEAFLRDHPNSVHAAVAASEIEHAREREREEAARKTAFAVGTADALRQYLSDFPSSFHAKEAKSRLEKILAEQDRLEAARARAAEDAAWHAATAAGSITAIQAFLRQYPETRHTNAAKKEIERLEAERRERSDWEAAIATHDIDVWRMFVKRHPRSPRIDEARRRVAELENKRRSEQEKRERAEAPAKQKEETLRLQQQEEESRRRNEEEAAAERRRQQEEDARRREAEKRGLEAEAERVASASTFHQAAPGMDALLKDIEAVRRQTAPGAPPDEAKTIVSIQGIEAGDRVAPTTTPELTIPTRPRTLETRRRNPTLIFGGAAAAVALIVTGIVFLSRDEEPPPPPIVDSSPPIQPSTNVTVPAPADGQLIVNALPWGEVVSIRDEAGNVKDPSGNVYLPKKPIYTPVSLTLPPGAYKIELSNPNSGRSVTLDAKVDPGQVNRAQTQLDNVNADEYLRKLSKQ